MSAVTFRQLNRVSVRLPLCVTFRSHATKVGPTTWQMNPEVERTVTENLCSGGCYFFLLRAPLPGTKLELEVTIPGDMADVPFAKIYCHGKVIRVDPDTTDPERPRFGVAAAIERLQDVNLESIPAPTGHAAAAGTGA